MIIDLKKIKRSGKDSSSFFFEYEPEDQLIEIPNVNFSKKIEVVGDVILTGEHSAVIEGEVNFTIKGECTRCLKETEKEYSVELRETADADNPEVYPVKNDTIDLSKMVDDALLMNLPLSFLCDEDCKGICLGCGVNLNDGECKCKNE